MYEHDRKGECQGNRDKCNIPECPKFGLLNRPSRDGKRRVRGCNDPTARGKGIELKVMLKPDMPDTSWDCLQQATQALGMKNIGRVFFALKLRPVRKSARLKQDSV